MYSEGIQLIIVDEIDRLKLQHLEQLRDIYDQHDLAMIFNWMPGIEKRLARYPQLYTRIGFAHEFQKLSKDEMHQSQTVTLDSFTVWTRMLLTGHTKEKNHFAFCVRWFFCY